MSKAFNLSLIQTSAGTDKNENVERTESLIRKAASDGANVICLQELFNTPYFCATVDLVYPTAIGTWPAGCEDYWRIIGVLAINKWYSS